MIKKQTAKANNIKIIDSKKVLDNNQAELIEKLKEILPSVINSDNQLDTKALQDVINISDTTSNNQGYELTFAGKGIARAMADKPTELELTAKVKQSKNFDETQNTVIRGDNLEVLKILQANYFKKIKMIYIDPPYNTKSENFIYKDNFKQSDDNLINDFGLDEEAVDFLHNVYGTRSHSGWLSFMYPRLKLARDLLTDDGVIFISIDDNEQANLKILCDEIFGADNFVGEFIWKNKLGGANDTSVFVVEHENILCYSKNIDNIMEFTLENKDNGKYLYQDEFLKERGKYAIEALYRSSIQYSESLFYEVKCPDGTIILPNESDKNSTKHIWRWSKNTFEKKLKEGRVEFKKTKNGWRVFSKQYFLQDDNGNDRRLKTRSIVDFIGNRQGTEELKKMFDNQKLFTNPKPTKLAKHFVELSTNKNDTILDFFAGSGTTADAVMQLNAEDGGNRKFVLVQIDEPIDEKKNNEAYKFCTDNNFKPVISSITIERLNRAGEKIKADLSNKQGDLLDNKKLPDIGYKVFKTTKKPIVKQENDLFNIENKRMSVLDTLVNMLISTCKTLDTKIECLVKDKLYYADNEIYLLDNVEAKELENYQDLKINLDGWADINLTQYLNLGVGQKDKSDNITVIY